MKEEGETKGVGTSSIRARARSWGPSMFSFERMHKVSTLDVSTRSLSRFLGLKQQIVDTREAGLRQNTTSRGMTHTHSLARPYHNHLQLSTAQYAMAFHSTNTSRSGS